MSQPELLHQADEVALKIDAHVQTEDDCDAHDEKTAITDLADFEAEQWMKRGCFDYYCTFTFNERTHRANRLRTPTALHDFVERELSKAGYRGPFVIVAHDNRDAHYFHAHVLLADYTSGMCAGVIEHFRKFGNASQKDDGPIRGRGAYLYCANRAYSRDYDEEMVRQSFKWLRTPRKRGSGRGRGRGFMPAKVSG